MLLFGPRLIAFLPLVFLFPLALWRQPRLLVPLLIGTLLVCGPFMGLRLHLGKGAFSNGQVLRVLSCNIQNGDFNVQALSSAILELGADIVAFQECPGDLKLNLPAGWSIVQDGELAVISKYAIRTGIPL